MSKIMDLREEARAAWILIDPTFSDTEGYRDFFNEKYREMEERREAQKKQEAKRREALYKRGGWMKALRELDSPRGPVRLVDRMYREILKVGPDFSMEKKEDFKEGIELLGELMMIHDAFTKEKGEFMDMFGEYLQEYGKLNVGAGQFFTPINVCDMMVKMLATVEDLKGEPKTICDPAAGSGRFMLRWAKYYNDEVGMFNFLFFNVDVDYRMYVCGTMNALLNRIPSINIWGNSLSLECHEGIATMHPQWFLLSKEKAKEILVVGSPKAAQTTLTQP